MNSHEVDYKFYGDDMQFVEIELDSSETVVAEAGAMMMMDENIVMETIFGDGSNKSSSSGIWKALGGAAKRVITGESLFMTAFTNKGYNKQRVSFASPYLLLLLKFQTSVCHHIYIYTPCTLNCSCCIMGLHSIYLGFYTERVSVILMYIGYCF